MQNVHLQKDLSHKEIRSTLTITVTDLINWIVQILKRELVQLRISARKTGLMEPVEL